MFPHRHQRVANLHRWFLISGGIGLAVAIILADLMSHDLASTSVLEVLWPSGIVGILDPSTVPVQLLTTAVMYGGQFVLYGLIGLLAAGTVNTFSGRRHGGGKQPILEDGMTQPESK